LSLQIIAVTPAVERPDQRWLGNRRPSDRSYLRLHMRSYTKHTVERRALDAPAAPGNPRS